MSEASHPLFEALSPDVPVAYWKGGYVYPEQFQHHVYAIAESLPAKKYAVNLCEDRYLFLVSFAACLLRSQASILPPSRAEKELERILEIYTDAYCVVDRGTDVVHPGQFDVVLDNIDHVTSTQYEVDSDAVAAIVFTSGSTGVPQSHEKRWKDLVTSSLKLNRRLELDDSGFDTIIATVPPQHMYGFELSIIYPLVNRACMHSGRPFYPQDINNDLQEVSAPRILVTTPIHLRACNEADIEWPEIKSVISAASELPKEVAGQTEIKMKTRVMEVYGCTEAGAIATRRTTGGKRWRLLEGYSAASMPNSTCLHIPGLEDEIILPDRIEILDDESFYLVGRNSDIIKIGGKRASLSNFANILRSINGVEDGLIFNPGADDTKRPRLAAVVVAPSLSESDILQELARHIDRVFLPRRIVKVNHLPYSDAGKLTMDSVREIFNSCIAQGDRRVMAKYGHGG